MTRNELLELISEHAKTDPEIIFKVKQMRHLAETALQLYMLTDCPEILAGRRH